MPPTPESCRPFLAAFDIQGLFVEQLGWDRHNERITVTAQEKEYALRVVSKKSQFAIVIHEGEIPDKTTRTALDREIGKRFREHLTIIADKAGGVQWWRWVRRERNRPMVHREYVWRDDGSGEELLSRIPRIAFSIADEEEGRAHLVEVSGRSKDAFDADTITKKFYDRFKKEKDVFVKSIKGIPDVAGAPKDKKGADREWYGALMLNRLMLVYFIQKRGLLDRDTNYLRNRMSRVREILGKDRFHSFYRSFLLTLFHDGLSKKERTREIKRLIGDVPYLNGGVFEKHRLETPEVAIPDSAFEQVFEFFDDFRWCLDERDRTGDEAERERKPEINPDVLGYIFEKYINQKQMGAYYTKEDITGYIARNTIIPFILDRVAETCKVAFGPKGTAWKLLAADPDRYLYPAMRHGIIDADGSVVRLPKEIAAGLKDVTKRGSWNSAAATPYALPTETWREHIARRERCLEVRDTLRSGSVTSANDLVTLNLDIRQFAEDIIVGCEGPDSLRALWREIEKITVLDPTCGSGAFLFAALEILQPLYQACLNRMQALIDDADATGHKAAMPKERETLARIAEHHKNTDYFILKSIIINNLYGVDIMEEATEICRLRLFLKLVAQVDPSLPSADIEPLPDIDFNVRPGNALLGYATLGAIRAMEGLIDYTRSERDRIVDLASLAAAAYRTFREQQMELGMSAEAMAKGKADLKGRLAALEDELNAYLAREYGVPTSNTSRFEAWKTLNLPFHWTIDFYEVMAIGGFDVVIGNPPYVSTRAIDYLSAEARALKLPDLYAHVLLRTLEVCRQSGRCGMIVPLSLTFSEDFGLLRQRLVEDGTAWFSSFDNIPAALFSGVSQRCTIWLGARDSAKAAHTTALHRWRGPSRPSLLQVVRYAGLDTDACSERGLPRLFDAKYSPAVLKRLRNSPQQAHAADSDDRESVGFSQAARNFVSVFVEAPPAVDAVSFRRVAPSMVGAVALPGHINASAGLAATAGELFLWYWLVRGDGFHVTTGVVRGITGALPTIQKVDLNMMTGLGQALHDRRFEALVFKKNAGRFVGNYNYRGHSFLTRRADLILMAGLGLDRAIADRVFADVQRVLSINERAGEKSIPKRLKSMFRPEPVDLAAERRLFAKIDKRLMSHFGYTSEELEFILNHEVTYSHANGESE